MAVELDDVDVQLLALLQSDADWPNVVDLAREVGLLTTVLRLEQIKSTSPLQLPPGHLPRGRRPDRTREG